MQTNRVLPFKDMGGCSISGVMDESGRLFSGEEVIRSIANMHERSNGLGGGFAAYGIYPDRADEYAMHLMFETPAAKAETDTLLDDRCIVHHDERIPTRPHPNAPNSEVFHKMVGPGVGLMDRVRDKLTGRTTG